MKKQDKFLFGLVALAVVLIGAGLILPRLAKAHRSRPPLSFQREHQRRLVLERMEAAGGWEVLRTECQSLVATNSASLLWKLGGRSLVGAGSSNHVATYFDHGFLPPGLARLKPREVTVTSSDPLVVRIQVFGYPSTGGGTPYYYLYVVCSPTREDFTPELEFSPHPLLMGVIRKITSSVFEVY